MQICWRDWLFDRYLSAVRLRAWTAKDVLCDVTSALYRYSVSKSVYAVECIDWSLEPEPQAAATVRKPPRNADL